MLRRIECFAAFVTLLSSVGPGDAQVVINEVCAANRTVLLDDEGDAPDWVELLNAGEATVDLNGWAISDRAEDAGKWRFPEYLFEPGERLLIWCSDKNRTLPAEASIVALDSPVPFLPTFISLADTWRWIAAAPEVEGPPADWATPDFDDSGWEAGLPPFGFGESFIVTEIPGGTGAAFFRCRFEIDDPGALSSFIAEGMYDDGAVIYINGVRVLDINYIEPGEPTFQSRARSGAEARTPRRYDLTPHIGLLRPGANTIAIAAINLRETSSDLVCSFEFGSVPPTFHTNFNLDSAGEAVILSDEFGEVVDLILFPEQARDRSYGRFADGTGPFVYMLFPTPREPNDSHVSDRLIHSDVVLEPPPGRYSGPQTVAMSINIPFEDVTIRYTLNGSPPSATSTLYEGPVAIQRDSVIRVAAFIGNNEVTSATSNSYWGWTAQARTLSLPVVSISMLPSDYSTVHNDGGARGIGSERRGYMEVFDSQGRQVAGVNMGLRIHGGAGRGGDFNTKKAYRVYFRGRYGDKKLRYPILSTTDVDEFDKLVLRSNFNDAFRTGNEAAYVRDQVIRDLHADMGGTISHGDWYNLFVNMQYRGVYNIVERMDKDFFAPYFPDDGENWDVIKTGDDVLDGDGRMWSETRSWFQRSNLSDPAFYEEAWRRIDVENFTSYMLVNIWSQNHDWPHNNWYAARPRRDDGRWIFLSWDAEFGIGRSPGGWTADTFAHVMGRSTFFTDVLRSLLRSPEYQTYFIAQMDDHFANALDAANVLRWISAHAAIVRPDMAEECALTGRGIATWEANIRTCENFARGRVASIANFIMNSTYFGFPRVTSVSPRRVELVAPTEIELRGTRFTEQTTVKFNAISAQDVVVESSRVLRCTMPIDASLEGRPAISVSDPVTGSSTSSNLLTVEFARPDLDLIEPSFGAPGDFIRVRGGDFADGVRVDFGEVPAPVVSFDGQDRDTLLVEVPEGAGSVEVRVVNTVPIAIPSTNSVAFDYDPDPSHRFRRGDSDGNGILNITDALVTLRILFQTPATACDDALDADDSGTINISDPVAILNFLFRDGFPPPADPFPHCHSDPTEDRLGCEADSLCGQL